LDLFPALSPDSPACDQRDLMERPFFSLAKSRRVAPIDYRAGDTVIRVDAAPDYGMATIWDGGILIWAASQIVEARERGLAPSRLFQGLMDHSLALRIDPAYFTLSGGIERWLYPIVRKHGGRQSAGWRFRFRQLYVKSGSLARFSDFAIDLRSIVARQALPGYWLELRREPDGEASLHFTRRSLLDLAHPGYERPSRFGPLSATRRFARCPAAAGRVTPPPAALGILPDQNFWTDDLPSKRKTPLHQQPSPFARCAKVLCTNVRKSNRWRRRMSG
jgi:plasmid replication initiation protein